MMAAMWIRFQLVSARVQEMPSQRPLIDFIFFSFWIQIPNLCVELDLIYSSLLCLLI